LSKVRQMNMNQVEIEQDLKNIKSSDSFNQSQLF